MTKIILGTSKLGWDSSNKNYKSQIEVVEFFLRKNYQIHISASYGYSLNRIRKIKILSKSKSSFLLKISFDNKETLVRVLNYNSPKTTPPSSFLRLTGCIEFINSGD